MSFNIQSEEKILQLYSIYDSLEMLVLIIISALLQWHYHTTPHAFFFLQNFGYLLIAYGLLLNLNFGLKWVHYLLSTIGAFFTATTYFFAYYTMKQQITFLYIPMYIWYLAMTLFFIWSVVYAYTIKDQINEATPPSSTLFQWLVKILSIIYAIFLLANVVMVYMSCGLGICT